MREASSGDGDRGLVRRMLAGDERAFEEFSDRHIPALYRFALHRLRGDRELARDVAQSTICRALAGLASFRGEASLTTWLCACCRREIAGHFRRLGRRPREVELVDDGASLDLAAPSDGPERRTLRRETAGLVHAALDLLPEHYGRALHWKYLEGLPVKEIARRLETSAKAAESLLTRAREAFRLSYRELTAAAEEAAVEGGEAPEKGW